MNNATDSCWKVFLKDDNIFLRKRSYVRLFAYFLIPVAESEKM